MNRNATKAESIDPLTVNIHKEMLSKLSSGNSETSALEGELSHFIEFGSCYESCNNPPTCLNPTLLDLEHRKWNVNYLATPFDAFAPFPLGSESIFQYCLSTLEDMISAVRLRKEHVTFTFSDSTFYELSAKNKFQVIHCYNTTDQVGLANLLPVANRLLVEGDPDAVVVTESASWKRAGDGHLTVGSFLESSLCCPISMIPMMYGLRLGNHLDLGSTVPIEFHDHRSTGTVKLQWHKTPSSLNIKMGFSSELVEATIQLAKCCFIPSYTTNAVSTIDLSPLPYSPMTFYNIIRSLLERSIWTKDYLSPHEPCSPLNPIMVPSFFRLVWKSIKAWLMNQSVLFLTATNTFPHKAILKWKQKSPVQLLLISAEEFKIYDTKPGKVLPQSFFKNSHCIDDLKWSNNGFFSATTIDTFELSPFSLLLAKDHGLNTSTMFCIIDIKTSTVIFSLDFFSHFSCTSFELTSDRPNDEYKSTQKEVSLSDGLNVLCCLEFFDRYELDLAVRSKSKFKETGKLDDIILMIG